MAQLEAETILSETFERIEQSILPSLALMVDGVIEASSLARAGHDADRYAAELRTLAAQLEGLTRQVESLYPAGVEPAVQSAASAA